MRILQDFKLINGDGVGEILLELRFPEGALVEKAVNDRMANHFDNKGAQGVRVIDSDTGKIIYKQTWWDERRRRESAANELRKARFENTREVGSELRSLDIDRIVDGPAIMLRQHFT